MRGTPDDFAVLSAMPAAPNAPGAVRRKTGAWYERVVFDDAQRIATPWKPVPGRPNIWQTNPGFVKLEWINRNMWPWRGPRIPLTDRDATPLTTAFTVAPYMPLQDGDPLLWADTADEIREPGFRSYDQSADTLTIRGNTFANNGTAIDPVLPRLAGNGLISIDANRFFENGDPQFDNPAGFDFRQLRLTRMFGKSELIRIKREEGGHGGADPSVRNLILRDTGASDPLKLKAGSLPGAYSSLAGIAAYRSMERRGRRVPGGNFEVRRLDS